MMFQFFDKNNCLMILIVFKKLKLLIIKLKNFNMDNQD